MFPQKNQFKIHINRVSIVFCLCNAETGRFNQMKKQAEKKKSDTLHAWQRQILNVNNEIK